MEVAFDVRSRPVRKLAVSDRNEILYKFWKLIYISRINNVSLKLYGILYLWKRQFSLLLLHVRKKNSMA
jgi:hypothetical protein